MEDGLGDVSRRCFRTNAKPFRADYDIEAPARGSEKGLQNRILRAFNGIIRSKRRNLLIEVTAAMREPAFFQPSNLLAHRIRLLSALLIPLQEYVLL